MSANSGVSGSTFDQKSKDLSLDINDLQMTEDHTSQLVSLSAVGIDEQPENDDQTDEICCDSNSDCSINSFQSDLGSLSWNDEVEDYDDKITQVTDKIIKLFTVQKRKALIDQADAEEDLVDYDTSVKRLFTFAYCFAFILAVIASILSILLIPEESSVTIHYPLKSEISQSIPHLVLLFNDGSMEVYEFSSSNTKLIHSWNFKVPHQKGSKGEHLNELEHHLGYTLLISKSEILIFYMGGNKDITILTNNGKSNLTHQSIRQSKVPRNMFYNSKALHIGNKVWLFGGMDQIVAEVVPTYFFGYWYLFDLDAVMNYGKISNKTLIWNIERQTFYPGPILPDVSITQGCPISLNRTHTMMLYIDIHKNNCLNAWIYSFVKHQWSFLSECFYKKQPEEELRFNLMCTSYYGKDKILRILVAVESFERFLWDAASLDLLVIDFKKEETSISKINHNFETSSK